MLSVVGTLVARPVVCVTTIMTLDSGVVALRVNHAAYASVRPNH